MAPHTRTSSSKPVSAHAHFHDIGRLTNGDTSRRRAQVIPPGYTFLNLDTMITVDGKELADELMKRSEGRNPDNFDMYIYNDFWGYGVIDLVDETLTRLNTKIATKKYDDAYSILEAVTVFMDTEWVWTQIDDGERVRMTNKFYGALAVAVLRGLKKAGRLNKESFPSLECLLKNINSLGEGLNKLGNRGSAYTQVVRGLGRELFKNKSEEDIALEKKQREEWVNSIEDEEDKEQLLKMMRGEKDEDEDEDEEEEEEEGEWYMKGEACDIGKRNSTYSLNPVYKEYKLCVPPEPRGFIIPTRPCYDIEEWPEEQKKKYSFAAMDADD